MKPWRDNPILTSVVMAAIAFLSSCGEKVTVTDVTTAPQVTSVARPGIPGFGGVDVVFVVDQSGSMDGDQQDRPSDPRRRRIEAVWVATSRLIQDARGSNPPRVHRIAVVEFGTSARIALPPTQITDLSSGATRSLLEMVASRVKNRNMHYTNTLEGLALAADTLAGMRQDRDQLPLGTRVERILLFTDGKPQLSQQPADYELQVRNQLRQLTGDARRLPAETLWVAGLIGGENFWTEGGWGSFWEKLAPGQLSGVSRVQGIRTHSDIRTHIRGIIDTWLGNQVLVGPDHFPIAQHSPTYLCPPYLRSVIFDVELGDRSSKDQVRILDPNGKRWPESAFMIVPGGRSMQLVVDNPLPGIWNVQGTQPDAYRVTAEPLYQEYTLEQPVTPQQQQTNVEVAYAVSGHFGSPFVEDPAYPIDASIRIEAPSGSDHTITLTHRGHGRFATLSPWVPAEPGNHRVFFGGTVKMKDATGKQILVEVFPPREPRFQVIEVSNDVPLALVLERPFEGDTTYLLFGRGQIEVEGYIAKFSDIGTPLGRDIANDIDAVTSVAITNTQEAEPIPLRWIDGRLRARLDVRVPLFSWRWLARQGKAGLQFILASHALRPGYVISTLVPLGGKQRVDTLRLETIRLREGLLSWAGLLGALVLILLLGIALAYRVIRNWYYVWGDQKYDHQPTLFFGHRLYESENQPFAVGTTGKRHKDVLLKIGSSKDIALESLNITRLSLPGHQLRVKLHLVFPKGTTIPPRLAELAGIAIPEEVETDTNSEQKQMEKKSTREGTLPECLLTIRENCPAFIDESGKYRFLLRNKQYIGSF